MTVDAIVEEEASVVDIAEDVHPAEMANDVEAEFIGRAPTVAMVEDRNVALGVMARDEAVVVSVAENVQSPGMDPREANATLVGSGDRRSVSYSSPPTQRPPQQLVRCLINLATPSQVLLTMPLLVHFTKGLRHWIDWNVMTG